MWLARFVSWLIEEEGDLTFQTPEQHFDRFRLDLGVNDEVVAIDWEAHCVTTGRRAPAWRELSLTTSWC
ncbi:MAG TPA: hypothetical protein VNG12_18880 [Acidimicrobiales bacterium]|nr:hypothetical protein [Acidimicrobiales bacterium]